MVYTHSGASSLDYGKAEEFALLELQSNRAKSAGWSALHGDRLELEVAAAKQCGGADEFAGRQVLCGEVTAVGGVELVVEGKIGARDLDVGEIVHAQAGLDERSFDVVEQQFDFLVDIGRRLTGLGIESDASRKVERVAGEDRAAEGELRIVVGQIDGATRGRRRRLRQRSMHRQDSSDGETNQCENGSAVHEVPLVISTAARFR